MLRKSNLIACFLLLLLATSVTATSDLNFDSNEIPQKFLNKFLPENEIIIKLYSGT